MSQTTNFQIRLTNEELQTLNSRAVTLTATNEKPHSLQDVVRVWIKAGCQLGTEKPKKVSKNARQHRKTH